MAEFLDLRGQRASPRPAPLAIDEANPLPDSRSREPPPVDSRIAPGIIGRKQIPVFDIQQGIHQNARDFFERRVLALREPARLQHETVTVDQTQSCLRLLAIDRIEPSLNGFQEFFGLFCLRRDRVTGIGQSRQHLAESCVPQAAVIRPLLRKPQIGIGARMHVPAELGRQRGKERRLQRRLLHLTIHGERNGSQGDKQHRPAEQSVFERHPAAELLLIPCNPCCIRHCSRRIFCHTLTLTVLLTTAPHEQGPYYRR